MKRRQGNASFASGWRLVEIDPFIKANRLGRNVSTFVGCFNEFIGMEHTGTQERLISAASLLKCFKTNPSDDTVRPWQVGP